MRKGYFVAGMVSASVCLACIGLAIGDIARLVLKDGWFGDGRPLLAAETKPGAPPGLPEEWKEQLARMQEKSEAVRDFTMFQKQDVGGGVQVHTGSRFADVEALLALKPESEWCYALARSAGFENKINLLERDARGEVRRLKITPEAAAALGMDVRRTEALRGLCRFVGGSRDA